MRRTQRTAAAATKPDRTVATIRTTAREAAVQSTIGTHRWAGTTGSTIREHVRLQPTCEWIPFVVLATGMRERV